VEVLYFDGQGDKGLESAGVAFDRRIVQQAYTKKYGRYLDENLPEFTTLLKDFESVKISNHHRYTKQLENYLNAPDDMALKEAYKFSGYAVTLGEVNEAFAPISQGIKKVIKRVIAHTQEQKISIDRIFMVGGFCQFLLVRRAITDALGIVKNDPRIDKTFNTTSSAYAISYGACLIANGLVDPTEKYIHTLGIILETITNHEERVKKEISLIEGGSNLDTLAQPNFFTEAMISFRQEVAVTLWVQLMSKGKKYQELMPDNIELPNYYSGAKYRVGMKVDRSQIAYLVIEEVSARKPVEYKLGDIIAKMFPGFVLFDEEEEESDE
jgi:molecular chaperone DnaK